MPSYICCAPAVPGATCRARAFRRARRSTTSSTSFSVMASGRRSGPEPQHELTQINGNRRLGIIQVEQTLAMLQAVTLGLAVVDTAAFRRFARSLYGGQIP